jgi:hypothetical protein
LSLVDPLLTNPARSWQVWISGRLACVHGTEDDAAAHRTGITRSRTSSSGRPASTEQGSTRARVTVATHRCRAVAPGNESVRHRLSVLGFLEQKLPWTSNSPSSGASKAASHAYGKPAWSTSASDHPQVHRPREQGPGRSSRQQPGTNPTAWIHRPDQFGNVISHCGSFVNIRGAHQLPSLVRQAPRKPVRVWHKTGSRDVDVIARPLCLRPNRWSSALLSAATRLMRWPTATEGPGETGLSRRFPRPRAGEVAGSVSRSESGRCLRAEPWRPGWPECLRNSWTETALPEWWSSGSN